MPERVVPPELQLFVLNREELALQADVCEHRGSGPTQRWRDPRRHGEETGASRVIPFLAKTSRKFMPMVVASVGEEKAERQRR